MVIRPPKACVKNCSRSCPARKLDSERERDLARPHRADADLSTGSSLDRTGPSQTRPGARPAELAHGVHWRHHPGGTWEMRRMTGAGPYRLVIVRHAIGELSGKSLASLPGRPDNSGDGR
jgi:hypothetical protein